MGSRGEVYLTTWDSLSVLTPKGKLRYQQELRFPQVTALPHGEFLTYSGGNEAGVVSWWRPDGTRKWTCPSPHSGHISAPYVLPTGDILASCLGGIDWITSDGTRKFFVDYYSVSPGLLVKTPPVRRVDGTLLLLSYWEGAVVCLSSTGKVVRRLVLTPSFAPAASRLPEGGFSETGMTLGQDGTLYLVGGVADPSRSQQTSARLRAFSGLQTERWAWDGPTFYGLEPPAVRQDGSVVYYPDPLGRLCALRAQDGGVLWRFALPNGRRGQLLPPSLDGAGQIFTVERASNALVCLSPKGKLRWQVPLLGKHPGRPIIGPNRSVLVSTDRYLYCIE